jgi:hypothetical protein
MPRTQWKLIELSEFGTGTKCRFPVESLLCVDLEEVEPGVICTRVFLGRPNRWIYVEETVAEVETLRDAGVSPGDVIRV